MLDNHRLKPIIWKDPETQIQTPLWVATQNENGPCPLIALVNFLILTGKIKLDNENNDTTKTVLTQELVSTLTAYLYSTQQDCFSKDSNLQKVIALLPNLSKGLDVNIQFDNIHGVEKGSDADLIFRAFDVNFVHGWVVSPLEQGELFQILSVDCKNNYEGAASFVFYADSLSNGSIAEFNGNSDAHQAENTSSTQNNIIENTESAENTQYNDNKDHETANNAPSSSEASGSNTEAVQNKEKPEEILTKALIVSDFFNQNPTQITPYGLQLLGEALENHKLAVMFRNNHFVTLYKRGKGELFTLCTDESLATDSRIVWETLNDVNQLASFFVDSFFTPMNNTQDGNGNSNDFGRAGGGGGQKNNNRSSITEGGRGNFSDVSSSNQNPENALNNFGFVAGAAGGHSGSNSIENHSSGGNRRKSKTDSKGKSKQMSDADYIRNDSEEHKSWFSATQTVIPHSQVDLDYQLALELQQHENESRSRNNGRNPRKGKGPKSHKGYASQYRQLDTLPPGMTDANNSLYGVPIAANDGQQSNSQLRVSDNNGRRYTSQQRQQSVPRDRDQKRSDKQSSCVIS